MFAWMPASALSEEGSSLRVVSETTLDIDHDGRRDRAALVQRPQSGSADLYIYLGGDGEPLDLSRRPTMLKKDIASGAAMGLETNGKGSLIVRYGCGGCSNASETTLTIIHRKGTFWIGGYALNWDTRAGMGSCEINFLTGRGIVSQGLEPKTHAIRVKAAPIALTSWSQERQPKACRM